MLLPTTFISASEMIDMGLEKQVAIFFFFFFFFNLISPGEG